MIFWGWLKINKFKKIMILKTNHTSALFLILILFNLSCTKELKYSKLSKYNNLKEGEWFNTNDTLNVMSVRNDKLVFIEDFRNIDFTSHDVFDYSIVDSISKKEDIETIFGQYLILKNTNEQINLQIISLNDSVIQFKKDNNLKVFKWKFIARVSKSK